MNPENLTKVKLFLNFLKRFLKTHPKIFRKLELVICPPSVYFFCFKNLKSFNILLGAQNFYFEEKGPFTGEISVSMLKDFNVKYVIVGHSERRNIFLESNDLINKKLKKAISVNLKPIFCIGEKEKDKIEGKTFEVLKEQITQGLKGILPPAISKIIVAYEPVWAIGTGRACDPANAKEVLNYLRKIFPKNFILYGGSVNSENARHYLEIGFNGLLIGGSSLLKDEFSKILLDLSLVLK